MGVEEFVAGEIKHECHSQLVDGLAEDHLPHCEGEEGSVFWDGFAVEDLFCGGICCSGFLIC